MKKNEEIENKNIDCDGATAARLLIFHLLFHVDQRETSIPYENH
jgi:hypothetical protein